jgi:hypothetical protein
MRRIFRERPTRRSWVIDVVFVALGVAAWVLFVFWVFSGLLD